MSGYATPAIPAQDARRTQFTQTPAITNTWYTALNLSAAGILTGVVFAANALATDVEYRITVDGGTAQTFLVVVTEDRIVTGAATNHAFWPRTWARFFSTLLVEVRNTGADTILRGSVYYSVDQ